MDDHHMINNDLRSHYIHVETVLSHLKKHKLYIPLKMWVRRSGGRIPWYEFGGDWHQDRP